eukprot:scaffold51102_cov37-Prasinocladus_malaysianus.AAC.1
MRALGSQMSALWDGLRSSSHSVAAARKQREVSMIRSDGSLAKQYRAAGRTAEQSHSCICFSDASETASSAAETEYVGGDSALLGGPLTVPDCDGGRQPPERYIPCNINLAARTSPEQCTLHGRGNGTIISDERSPKNADLQE